MCQQIRQQTILSLTMERRYGKYSAVEISEIHGSRVYTNLDIKSDRGGSELEYYNDSVQRERFFYLLYMPKQS